MAYDLKLFTGYHSGIYSYATKTTGGHEDIDFFDYERTDWNPPSVIEPDANDGTFTVPLREPQMTGPGEGLRRYRPVVGLHMQAARNCWYRQNGCMERSNTLSEYSCLQARQCL